MDATPDSAPPRPRIGPTGLILLLALLQSLTPLSVDLYLPALPTIGRSLGASQGSMQLTLSGFLVGFGLGQLAWGPIGDRFGRKRPMLAGLLVYLIASVGCALAADVWTLAGWRVLQALGGCALPVLGSAMVRDCFEREEGAKVRSFMAIVGGTAPMLAPLIGGQLMLVGSWRLMFWCLTGFGAVCVLAAASLSETLTPDRRRALRPLQMVQGYGELFTHRAYLGHVLPAGFIGAGMFAYISGTPFVYIQLFHVPPQAYGFLFGLNMAGMMAASALNGVLVRRLGTERMLRLGCETAAAAGLALAAVALANWGGLAAIVVAIFCYVSMMGPVSANAAAGALEDFPHKAGAAAALIGCLSMGLGSLSGALVGALADGSPRPMALVMAGLGLAALLSNRLLLPRRRRVKT